MPDYSIPMSQNIMQMPDIAGRAMAESAAKPSVIKPIDYVNVGEESARAYKMASDKEQNRLNLENQRDTANDKLILDQYEKSSPDKSFLTPDSVQSAMKELKGKLSTSGMSNLEQLYETRKMNSLKMKDEMSKLNTDKLAEDADKYEFNARYVYQPTLDTYNNTLKNTGDKTKAMQDFATSRQAAIQMASQLKNADGTPAFPPEALKAMSQATPEKMESVIASTKYRAEHAKAELDQRKGAAEVTKEEAQAVEARAKAKYYEKGGAGQGMKFANLNPDQQEALDKALSEGKLDPRKLNSRTASMWANQFITNPNLDMNKLSSEAALMQNVQFMNRAITLETLPEVMTNMVDAGKKVGFSDIRSVGKMQAFLKGETNDPDLAEYMAMRNDALMTIASSMRGVGMSDMAHQAETEAAAPTMSPQALDGWLKGQMKSLEPRLKRFQKYTRSNEPAGGKTEEPAKGGGKSTSWSASDEARLKELEAKHGAQ